MDEITERGSGVKKGLFQGGRGLKKEVPGTAGVKKRGSRDSGG